MLIKRTDRRDHRTTRADCSRPQAAPGMDRRTFLRRAGLTSGSLAALGGLSLSNDPRILIGAGRRARG
jgi:formate dehydrogenase major subunit